jgi:hypothetical protein
MSHAMHRLPLNAAQRVKPQAIRPAPHRHSPSLAAAQLVLCTARAVGDDSERANAAFISATRLYEDCHWEFAFERVALLADHGHTPAAKLALLMLRYGRALYGTSFVAHPGQVARWAQRVLRATSRATASPSSMTAIA